ncbi:MULTISPECIES: membrane protein insertion efficiency factor YidD [unclassified Nostoc]|uniref:membrane protein insertion efficiency factor YidD n=1 Tax=unclassified Nostoc TaxID=2593658 RepID=UPI001DEF2286|nr:membrane protein insertion efficiency factor YidD [Nostoc sp. JL23]MBN3877117.1 membrane protein insertion efficiency factor YidD [Nostoc sp. JL23]
MQISLFDSLTRQVGTAAITGYQKHISPHKGFACAHRILYGGESCSQYIKRVVAKEGLKVAFVNSRERFQACKEANQILRMHSENSEESPEEKADRQQRQASGKVTQKSSFISNDNTNCFDCADLGCNCAEIVSMTPDCGSLDCGAANCSSLDCSGADCSFLDCGSCGS